MPALLFTELPVTALSLGSGLIDGFAHGNQRSDGFTDCSQRVGEQCVEADGRAVGAAEAAPTLTVLSAATRPRLNAVFGGHVILGED